jgi:hypothetical protein
MEDQRNIHYRVGGRLTHCGVECLPQGKDIERIIIARIEYKESEMINGRTEKGVWVAYFAPNKYTDLPFILNATNRKRLVKLYPDCDGYLARLENIPVRLTKEETRDVQDGGTTWGLRISRIPASEAKPEAPAQKKVISESQIDKIVDWAKKKGYDFAKVAEVYDFESDTVKDAIVDALSVKPSDDLPE